MFTINGEKLTFTLNNEQDKQFNYRRRKALGIAFN
jgi:hypothetical protein